MIQLNDTETQLVAGGNDDIYISCNCSMFYANHVDVLAVNNFFVGGLCDGNSTYDDESCRRHCCINRCYHDGEIALTAADAGRPFAGYIFACPGQSSIAMLCPIQYSAHQPRVMFIHLHNAPVRSVLGCLFN